MAVSISTPADLANNSLTRLGFKLTVGSLLDGSDHANTILQVYAQTRDEVLRNFDYDFAQRTVALTLLKQAPAGGYFPPNAWNPTTYPPIGWTYEYAFPDDAIKIRTVKQQPAFLMNAAPLPWPFSEYNDTNISPAQRTIVTNVPDAIAVYTGRVTDPTEWDVSFAEAFAAALARRVAAGLVGLEAVKAEAQDEQIETVASEREQR